MTEISTPVTENEGASKGTVAFLGPVASFTHQATLKDFPEGTGWTYKSCATIKDIVTTVAAGEASYGVVPFENSTYGPVADSLDLLAASPTAYPTLHVIAESYIDVHHALVGRKPPKVSTIDDVRNEPPSLSNSSLPTQSTSTPSTYFSLATTHGLTPNSSGAATPTPKDPSPAQPRTKPKYPLSHIKTVFSHPQAFGQCAAFFSAYLKHAERHETSSTAAAAARVAAYEGTDQAAIASIAAGEARGLDILAEQIEDLAGNRTRFLTLTLRSGASSSSSNGGSGGGGRKDDAAYLVDAEGVSVGHKQKTKTLISFRLRPSAPPGALAAALAVFTDQGLDLTSIHPRPSGVRAWDYVFVVECVGGSDDEPVEKAMQVLAARVERCFLHGRYKDRVAE